MHRFLLRSALRRGPVTSLAETILNNTHNLITLETSLSPTHCLMCTKTGDGGDSSDAAGNHGCDKKRKSKCKPTGRSPSCAGRPKAISDELQDTTTVDCGERTKRLEGPPSLRHSPCAKARKLDPLDQPKPIVRCRKEQSVDPCISSPSSSDGAFDRKNKPCTSIREASTSVRCPHIPAHRGTTAMSCLKRKRGHAPPSEQVPCLAASAHCDKQAPCPQLHQFATRPPTKDYVGGPVRPRPSPTPPADMCRDGSVYAEPKQPEQVDCELRRPLRKTTPPPKPAKEDPDSCGYRADECFSCEALNNPYPDPICPPLRKHVSIKPARLRHVDVLQKVTSARRPLTCEERLEIDQYNDPVYQNKDYLQYSDTAYYDIHAYLANQRRIPPESGRKERKRLHRSDSSNKNNC